MRLKAFPPSARSKATRGATGTPCLCIVNRRGQNRVQSELAPIRVQPAKRVNGRRDRHRLGRMNRHALMALRARNAAALAADGARPDPLKPESHHCPAGLNKNKAIASEPRHLRLTNPEQNRAGNRRVHRVTATFEDIHRRFCGQRMRCGAHPVCRQNRPTAPESENRASCVSSAASSYRLNHPKARLQECQSQWAVSFFEDLGMQELRPRRRDTGWGLLTPGAEGSYMQLQLLLSCPNLSAMRGGLRFKELNRAISGRNRSQYCLGRSGMELRSKEHCTHCGVYSASRWARLCIEEPSEPSLGQILRDRSTVRRMPGWHAKLRHRRPMVAQS